MPCPDGALQHILVTRMEHEEDDTCGEDVRKDDEKEYHQYDRPVLSVMFGGFATSPCCDANTLTRH